MVTFSPSFALGETRAVGWITGREWTAEGAGSKPERRAVSADGEQWVLHGQKMRGIGHEMDRISGGIFRQAME
ncbi:hypothetical protein HAHE_14740 [Haloferula helveola]|uniref:Uncharacterized protein n=1 Tax=Haloferula helveola TaxID=490095 RepID=A0ABM7RDV6_9BACT|nr:hypothetical protein HAHE_14740 [Haloferula helveola]